LKEQRVKEIIHDWLKSQYPEKAVWRQSSGADISIFAVAHPHNRWEAYHTIAVECKGTAASNAKLDRAVGQSLRYYMQCNKPPAFLAVPHDYEKIKELRRIMGFYDLPIGLLIVHDDGKVEKVRDTKGQPSIEIL